MVFPEGTRNKTDEIFLPFKSGAAMIAHRAGVPIIPVALHPKNKKVKAFSKVIVTIGKPIPREELDAICKEDGSPDYKRQTEYIFSKIVELYDREVPEGWK